MANETEQQPPAVNPNEPTANAKKYAWALPPEKTALLSKSVERIDGPGKVSGTAKYTYDINRPGMLWARAVRSPHPHAKITAIDFSAAKKAPGVRAVLQWKDPGTEVMYQGDVVAAVAADSEDHARDAARLVKVTYETLPFAAREAASMDAATPKIFPNGNTRAGQATEVGDLAAGFKAAVDTLVRDIRNSPRMEGVQRIWLPGEQSQTRREANLRDGIALPLALLEQLAAYALDADITPLATF